MTYAKTTVTKELKNNTGEKVSEIKYQKSAIEQMTKDKPYLSLLKSQR